MVIHLNVPKDFRRALRYNERKVERGQALCIHAGNFILDADRLTLADKQARFARLDRLRPDHPRKFIHASLNFHPSDNPDREKFVRVATDYIREIGFADQPWLLYQHKDTRVPHVHLITSRVTSEGKILRSYTVFPHMVAILRQLEIEHGLIQSRRIRKNPQLALSTAQPTKPVYGQTLMRDAITSTLAYILPSYVYCNMTELNAILRQYGILADNGRPNGTLAAIRGLTYELLDQDGHVMGKRIGASAIGFDAGLDYLEARFRENIHLGPAAVIPLATRVQLAGLRAPDNWRQFAAELRSAGIDTVPFMNAKGEIYDIVVIDHSHKLGASVFRLVDPATLKHLHIREPAAIAYQRELSRDITRARDYQLLRPDDEQTLSLGRRKERENTLSR